MGSVSTHQTSHAPFQRPISIPMPALRRSHRTVNGRTKPGHGQDRGRRKPGTVDADLPEFLKGALLFGSSVFKLVVGEPLGDMLALHE